MLACSTFPIIYARPTLCKKENMCIFSKCQTLPFKVRSAEITFMQLSLALTSPSVTHLSSSWMTCSWISQQLLRCSHVVVFSVKQVFCYNSMNQTKDKPNMVTCAWMWASVTPFFHLIFLPLKSLLISPPFFLPPFFLHPNSHQRLLAPAQDHQLRGSQGSWPHQREDAAAARRLALRRQPQLPQQGPVLGDQRHRRQGKHQQRQQHPVKARSRRHLGRRGSPALSLITARHHRKGAKGWRSGKEGGVLSGGGGIYGSHWGDISLASLWICLQNISS